MNDIVLVDKPEGWTSFDVVAKLRSGIRATYKKDGLKPTKRQLKVGHTGTLDPFATGLLVILFGDACSRSNEFLKLDKVYEATIELGKVSSTGDPHGDISEVNDAKPVSDQAIRDVLRHFVGTIEQTPPAYSAIKVDGQRAYQLARQGKEVTIPSRQVEIYALELITYDYPFVKVRAHVSSGTYIRTLAEDIGKMAETGAYCLALRRVKVGTMSIDDAQTIESTLATIDRKADEQQDA